MKSGPSGTTIYAYDGANGVEELSTAGTATARYVQGAGIDEPLAQSSTALNYYSADGLGSITSMEDGSGTPQATFVYGAFGVLSSSTGSVNNSYRYTAREFDQDTGLYYYRARYYDPAAGRFLSEDVERFQADIGFYRYVLNTPANLSDPSGLEPLDHNPGYKFFGKSCPECESRAWQQVQKDLGKPFCFVKCVVWGFGDDAALGALSLLSKRARVWLASATGHAVAELAGTCGLVVAGEICVRHCKIGLYGDAQYSDSQGGW